MTKKQIKMTPLERAITEAVRDYFPADDGPAIHLLMSAAGLGVKLGAAILGSRPPEGVKLPAAAVSALLFSLAIEATVQYDDGDAAQRFKDKLPDVFPELARSGTDTAAGGHVN